MERCRSTCVIPISITKKGQEIIGGTFYEPGMSFNFYFNEDRCFLSMNAHCDFCQETFTVGMEVTGMRVNLCYNCMNKKQLRELVDLLVAELKNVGKR